MQENNLILEPTKIITETIVHISSNNSKYLSGFAKCLNPLGIETGFNRF